MYRSDGGIVDAELIRPRSWIKSFGIEAGKLLPMNIEELQVKGSALVTAVDYCPEIERISLVRTAKLVHMFTLRH